MINWTILNILSNISDMKKSTPRPSPALEKQMLAFGERLRAARMRRGISTVLFAERLNISRDTLNRLEKGDISIAMGNYIRALRVLDLEKDIDKLAQDDELGRKLQDLNLPLARKLRGTSKSSNK
jgi:transcriptional regulator with XRE-family HTH domain